MNTSRWTQQYVIYSQWKILHVYEHGGKNNSTRFKQHYCVPTVWQIIRIIKTSVKRHNTSVWTGVVTTGQAHVWAPKAVRGPTWEHQSDCCWMQPENNHSLVLDVRWNVSQLNCSPCSLVFTAPSGQQYQICSYRCVTRKHCDCVTGDQQRQSAKSSLNLHVGDWAGENTHREDQGSNKWTSCCKARALTTLHCVRI